MAQIIKNKANKITNGDIFAAVSAFLAILLVLVGLLSVYSLKSVQFNSIFWLGTPVGALLLAAFVFVVIIIVLSVLKFANNNEQCTYNMLKRDIINELRYSDIPLDN